MTYVGLFEVSAALAVLDVMTERAKTDLMPSAEDAWEAAWIGCLTGTAKWADEAEARFADVLTELGRRIRPGLMSTCAQGLELPFSRSVRLLPT